MLYQQMTRPGKVTFTDVGGYATPDILRFFRADNAHLIPAMYARMEETFFDFIRRPVNNALRGKIARLLTCGGLTFAYQGQPLLLQLRVSGGVLGQGTPADRQNQVALGRAVPARRLHRH